MDIFYHNMCGAIRYVKKRQTNKREKNKKIGEKRTKILTFCIHNIYDWEKCQRVYTHTHTHLIGVQTPINLIKIGIIMEILLCRVFLHVIFVHIACKITFTFLDLKWKSAEKRKTNVNKKNRRLDNLINALLIWLIHARMSSEWCVCGDTKFYGYITDPPA